MLFNSFSFLIFLPVVYFAYWALRSRSLKAQNALILGASYFFYAKWDIRFVPLLFGTTLIDFVVGILLDKTEAPRRRKWLLGLSLAANVGVLAFFKYYGFFVASFADLLHSFGLQANLRTLEIILPAGISFYTFQSMSYTIEVYRKELAPTRDPLSFFAFVSFFPHLVAGPIMRALNLLPQFYTPRTFDVALAKDGVRQMLWGFFKKVVIADNISSHVDVIFRGAGTFDSVTLIAGAFLFAIQIYCDFSGYSDIAIGCARLFGFSLTRNFAFPYFSRNIPEFWQRWHISLSTWFRDYVFIPLGGSRCSPARRSVNIITTFTVSGLWHGANWTFVVWGLLHGFYYLIFSLVRGTTKATGVVAEGRWLPTVGEFLAVLTTFFFTLVAWVFFRAATIHDAMTYLSRAASFPGSAVRYVPLAPVLAGIGMLAIEWIQRRKQHALEVAGRPLAVRWASYYAVLGVILFWGNFHHVPFIYFQF